MSNYFNHDGDISVAGDAANVSATAASVASLLPILAEATGAIGPYAVARGTTSTVAITSGANDLSAMFPVGQRVQTNTIGVIDDELQVLSVAYVNPTTTVTMTTAGVTAGIDGMRLRLTPKRVLVSATDTTATYIKFGQSTVSVSAVNGTGITRFGSPMIFTVSGQTHIAVIQAAATSVVSVTPLND